MIAAALATIMGMEKPPPSIFQTTSAYTEKEEVTALYPINQNTTERRRKIMLFLSALVSLRPTVFISPRLSSSSPSLISSSSRRSTSFFSRTNAINKTSASIMMTAAAINEYMYEETLSLTRTLISPSAMIPPTAPIRLMMAFALLRKGLTVMSGISDTAGER